MRPPRRGGVMKKRMTVKVLIGLVLVLLAWGLTTRLLAPTPGVTRENVDRLTLLMTFRDVKAILGEPETSPIAVGPHMDWPPDWDDNRDSDWPQYDGVWRGEQGTAVLSFSGRRELLAAHFTPSRAMSSSLPAP